MATNRTEPHFQAFLKHLARTSLASRADYATPERYWAIAMALYADKGMTSGRLHALARARYGKELRDAFIRKSRENRWQLLNGNMYYPASEQLN